MGSLLIVQSTNFLLILTVKQFENRSIFDEVTTYKTKCASFLGHPVEPTPIETTNSGSSRIDRFPNLFIYECHDIDVK